MPTLLPPPILGDWSGARVQNLGGGRYQYSLNPGARSLVIACDRLTPGHKITVSIRISTAAPGKIAVIRIGHSAASAGRGPIYERTASSDRFGARMEIEITGLDSGIVERLEITDNTLMPENPRPCDVLSLQAYYPLQGLDGLRWNQSRWNREAWTRGAENMTYLQWDRGAWDTRAWLGSGNGASEAWQDITGPCTEIAVTRGVDATGPALTGTVGTLTARAINALAPRTTGMSHGTPVRLIHWPTRELVYSGYLTDLQITPRKPGGRISYEDTLTASDSVARLAATTRYGAKSDTGDGSENWFLRLDRIIKSCRDLTYSLDSMLTGVTVPPTVWETSLAKHLDALTASVLGSWSVARNGWVLVRTKRPTTPVLRLTDAAPSDPVRRVLSYTGVGVSWAASDAIAHVTLHNHAARWDAERSEWEADDTDTTVDEPTAAAVWGGTSVQLDVTLPAAKLEETARRYLVATASDPTPSSVTLRPAHETGPDKRGPYMALASTIDPVSAVAIEYRGERVAALISQVSHTITPTSWTTQLSLTPNPTRKD